MERFACGGLTEGLTPEMTCEGGKEAPVECSGGGLLRAEGAAAAKARRLEGVRGTGRQPGDYGRPAAEDPGALEGRWGSF